MTWTNQVPLITKEAAVYPYSAKLKKRFSLASRYDDPINLYREIGKDKQHRILLPRQVCPMGVDKRAVGIPVKFDTIFKPRSDEQARVVNEASTLLLAGESFVVRAPTGFGKTICAMQMIHNVGRKTLVIVTKEDIRDQWIDAAKMILKIKNSEIGIIQGDQCNTKGKKFCIGMIQSLSKSGKYAPSTWTDFGLVIWDEVHRVAADHFSNSAWLLPAKLRLGLSATPERKDGKDVVIAAHIGNVRVATEQMTMIPKVLVVKSKFTLPMVPRKINGRFKQVPLPHTPGRIQGVNKCLSKNMTRNKMIGQFIKTAYKKDRNIIVFSDLKAHLDRLYEICVMNAIPQKDMAFYIGGLTKQERERAKVKAIIFATYAMTSEATDIPWMDTAVLCTPRSDVVQIVGRILREYPDKKEPIVFDVVDQCSNVLTGYYNNRLQWYKSIGAEVRRKN